MTWDRVAPPYKFFQLAAWESNETDGKYLLVERQTELGGSGYSDKRHPATTDFDRLHEELHG